MPWAELNVGGTVGDDPSNVSINRTRTLDVFDLNKDSVFDVWQIHSDRIEHVDQPRIPSSSYLQADGMVTNSPGVTLYMRFADCVPIFLYDPRNHTSAILHAGWKGTLRKIAVKGVGMMVDKFGSHPEDLIAVIGPSIGPDHYIVGEDVVSSVYSCLHEYATQVLTSNWRFDKRETFFDLWAANKFILREAGVKKIEIAGICTGCHTEDWYSHRVENGKTGRFGALITLI
jgi:YfiH family protein